jgi:hypothetical protein
MSAVTGTDTTRAMPAITSITAATGTASPSA